MAQDYVGSGNNVPLLHPGGQFGTRLEGGEDAASPRYIFTRLTTAARLLFPAVDVALLEHREDDGQAVEPLCYCPVVPLVLINGAQGVGTGWSTNIPNHCPLDVIAYVRGRIDGAEGAALPKIRPFVRGFTGAITTEKGRYVTTGTIEKTSRSSLHISELPVGRWTTTYKEHLSHLRETGTIRAFEENHTTSAVSFDVTLRPTELERLATSAGGLEQTFRLATKFATTNMHCFDADGNITKYGAPEDVAEAFFPARLALYRRRKGLLERRASYEAAVLENRARFVAEVAAGTIDLINRRRPRDATVGLLAERDFASAQQLEGIRDGRGDADGSGEDGGGPDFDYLLNMSVASFTEERVHDMLRNVEELQKGLEVVRRKSAEDMWKEDLALLEDHLVKDLNY